MPEPIFTDNHPVALTVAGSDCSSGAGLQADLKTFSTLGVYGLTAITCAVSEIPGKISRIEALSPGLLHDQVSLLCRTFPVAAIKTGVLCSGAHVESLVRALDDVSFGGPLVIDPVMVASSGDPLIGKDGIEACESLLFPRAALITPNMEEAGRLLNRPVSSERDLEPAARELAERYGVSILLKGGHLDGPDAIDFLCLAGGATERLSSPAVSGVATHGTGCTCSAAIAAHLARGRSLPDAVREAKSFVTRAIGAAYRWDSPNGEIHALNTG